MIKQNERCLGIYHRLIANKKIGTMKLGDIKDVLVMKMTDGKDRHF